jgi:hypothetical protein
MFTAKSRCRRPAGGTTSLAPGTPKALLARKWAASLALRVSVIFCALLLFPMALRAQDQDDERVAVPDKDAQQQALNRIKTIFPTEYAATTRDARAKFGKQLLELTDAERDAAARFTLLKEAVRLASENGDVETALEAVDGMGRGFAISLATVQAFALANLSKSVQTREAAEAVADHCLTLAEVLVAENRFDDARKTLADGAVAARKIRGSNPKATALRDAAAQVQAVAETFQKVAKSAATLEKNPNDPAANLELGQFECYEKGSWPKGLAHLAKGSDAALKKLAEQTLDLPAGAEAQAEIAGRWWATGQRLKGAQQKRVLGFASSLYEKALPKLTGLSKVTAQKRIAEVEPDAGGTAKLSARKVNLIELLEPATDFRPQDKWAITDGVLQCTQPHFVPKVVFPYEPPEEYDVTFSFSQPRLRNGVGLVLPNPNGGSFAAHFGYEGGRSIALSSAGDKYKRSIDNLFRADVKYTVVFKVRKQGLQAVINNTPVIDMKTDFSDLQAGEWHRITEVQQIGLYADDPTNFYQVEVTEVTGEGTLTRKN